VGAAGVGAGAAVGPPGVGEGVGFDGVPPPDDGPEPVLLPAGPVAPREAKIGVNPPNTVGVAGFSFVRARGRAGETSTGTLRTCVLGTASSRAADRSSVVNACSHNWAEATAPAATAPT
jgi:hypothetical protein